MEDLWKYNKKEIIIGIIVVIIVLIIGLSLFSNKSTKEKDIEIEEKIDKLVLFGDKEITLIEGEKYIEPGYYALTNKKEIKTKEVEVNSSEIDTNKPGTYQISYTISDKVEYRKIIVVEKEENDDKEEKENELTLELKGESVIELNIGNAYIEPGYSAKDNIDGDITDKVKVSGTVDTNKIGTYTINYEVENSSLKKVSKTRKIVVKNEIINATITGNVEKYTNKNITLTINVSGENFYYIKYPNGSVSKNKKSTYEIKENGTYKFLVYDKYNNYIVKEEVVDKIDKVKPSGSCKAEVSNGKTNITIGAIDNESGIKNYIIKSNGVELKNQTTNKYTYGKELLSVNVLIYDNALNYKNVNCVIQKNTKSSDKQESSDDTKTTSVKNPPSGYTKKYSASSSSLKINMVYKDGIYYSYIWAKNPVMQFNKQMVTGNSLQTPLSILELALKKQNLSNKIVLGFNASSMVDGVKYGDDLVKKDSRYNYKEMLPLLIYNGKVVINDYKNYPVNQVIYYMDGNSQLKYVPKLGNYSSSDRKKIFQDVINSGARNTIHFRPVLIYNGKAMSLESTFKNMEPDRKQALCQLDTNNFILATSTSSGKITYPNFVKKLLSLGCKTAFEFDGGGSTSLFFKKANQSSFTKITAGRNNSTMMFFTEL